MIRRNIIQMAEEALGDSPVVLLQGARQTGKTTLARVLAEENRPSRQYLTFDDASVLSAARQDPSGFIAGFSGPIVLDEVQFAPELFPAIKAAVDRKRVPGRFLLTGSANVLLLPKLSESLAGRLELLHLWPFSQGELLGRVDGLVDVLFNPSTRNWRLDLAGDDGPGLWERVVTGGYPEAQTRSSARRRRSWFDSYITTILQRDVRELANIDGLSSLPRVLELLASRTGGLQNFAELSRSLSIPQTSLKRYLTLLEATFLVRSLAPWSTNLGKRLVKSPKTYLLDTGLASSLVGLYDPEALRQSPLAGGLLENFVVMELTKQASWSEVRPKLFHYRTQAGQEVDLLLEDSRGVLVGLEVKASSSVTSADLKGLYSLQAAVGAKLLRGVVLYTGTEVIPFGSNFFAVPISALWRAR
jgi:uncharacterized protein